MEGVHEVVFEGDASLERVLTMLRELDERASGEAGLRVLIDQTNLQPGTVGPDDVRAIGDAWRTLAHIKTARLAVVAPSPAVFGLNRMAIAYADAGTAKMVFATREEAEAWLTL